MHHQSDDDWFCVGEIALDAPDLKDQVRALRDKGFALENDLSCTIVIPQDQVWFFSVATDGLPPEECMQKVQAALVDATPYPAEELAFHATTAGTTTYIAAVTRTTLEEAQEFSTDHGFIPIRFSTETDGQDFPTEPVFSLSMPEILTAEAVDETATDAPPAPNVHSIADTSAPDVFRSAPVKGSGKKPEPTPGPLAKRYVVPAGVALFVAAALGIWALFGSDNSDGPEADTARVENALPPPEASVEPGLSAAEEQALQPELSTTDSAVLEALNVAPTVIEEDAGEPEPIATQPGIEIITPEPLEAPTLAQPDDLYLASVDNSNLSSDAIAIPPVQSFDTDAPFDQVVLPSVAGTRFDLDERGLVTPTADGTLNPDGIVVYLGRPSKVPPDAPVRFEQEPILEDANDRLAGLRPKPRPDDLIERFERQQLGGRTREELAVLRPKLRPASLQAKPQVDETPTALAVVRVPRPKLRPAGLARSAAVNLGSTAAIGQSGAEAGSFAPKAVAPKIPSSASVARQATIDNALNLRKLNLIGVYGTPANRRALVRMPSGRYKKLKVGDRLDGGKVIAIGDSELRYQKKGRNLTLKMPRG